MRQVYIHAFSMLEILLSLAIISMCAFFILKPYTTENLALRQASLYIQTLQHKINDIAYTSFLQKKPLDTRQLESLLQSAAIQTKLFSLKWQQNRFVLQIGNKRLTMQIKQTHTRHYVITCNPSQELCRKLYHRKHKK